ncbi:hypothetical protein ACTOB_004876 [Actinoplanes oblitus]|uniref:UspA domain-containing protein n=1 Tax=Actinoplanes oblitus TaxID=3040509 RepID=A0ABY8W5X9_9ACTN|nr:hypothetical protein [Actinoplanes oblitus]WIM92917.1 hypothetical protein ACTOB_004876 [Actinoplanes oblitus]
MTATLVARPGVPAPPATRRIIVGVIGPAPVEDALRYAFSEAARDANAVSVVATGPATDAETVRLENTVRHWAGRYSVEAEFLARRGVDAVITLAAASRRADLLVIAAAPGPRAAATIAALRHRAHSAVRVVGASSGGRGDDLRQAPARPATR